MLSDRFLAFKPAKAADSNSFSRFSSSFCIALYSAIAGGSLKFIDTSFVSLLYGSAINKKIQEPMAKTANLRFDLVLQLALNKFELGS
jgi:hypothetical protein